MSNTIIKIENLKKTYEENVEEYKTNVVYLNLNNINNEEKMP